MLLFSTGVDDNGALRTKMKFGSKRKKIAEGHSEMAEKEANKVSSEVARVAVLYLPPTPP